MSQSLKDHASSAAALSLVTLCACVACFIPPLNERVVQNPALISLLGLAIACSGILHLVFIGKLAKLHGRSPGRFVALALFTLPVGSIVGLVLLEWHERATSAAPGRTT